jgi:hypothetical protein
MSCWPKHEIPRPDTEVARMISLTDNLHVNVFEVGKN